MKERKHRVTRSIVLTSIAAILASTQNFTCGLNAFAKQFDLNAEQKDYTPGDSGVPDYAPYPTFTPQKQPKKQPPKKQQVLKQQVEKQQQQAPPTLQQRMPQARPMPQMRPNPMFNLGAQRSVPLPPNFLGRWAVQGRKTEFVPLKPEFADGSQYFQPQTQDVWIISGNPNQGYAFSNDQGVKSPLIVDKVQGSQAFIRYQHQMNKTIAQEAIVLEVGPDGGQFNGMARMTIIKPGQGPNTGPRAKVTYQLVGFKQ